MTDVFNVAFDPWIPVVTNEGRRELVSLVVALTEGERFTDLAVRPHERVSLMRLFLCIAHAALNGPKDHAEWLEVPERLPQAARGYLKDWKDSFELFHKEKPWLQVSGLSKSADGAGFLDDGDVADWTPVSKLNFMYATGNNSTLFDHVGEGRSIALSDIVLSMLSFQCFSPGGLISQVYWKGSQSKKTSRDAPCVPASMVHAFLRGHTLLATIHLNLPTHEDIKRSYQRDIGKPVWEKLPASMNDSLSIENATTTYLGRLVPMTRLIRLHDRGDRMLLGDGLVYPTFVDGFSPEPTATVVIRQRNNKQERALLPYRPAKAVWRELAAVIVKRNAQGLGGPLCLKAIQDDEDADLIVAALARDQATIVDTSESVFHVPAKLRSAVGVVQYEEEVKHAEDRASKLNWAVETYRKVMDAGWEQRAKASRGDKVKLHAQATTHYWTTVEKNLSLLMAHIKFLGTDEARPARDEWRKMLISAARDAYSVACGQETPRQIKAFAEGWGRLPRTWNDQPNAT